MLRFHVIRLLPSRPSPPVFSSLTRAFLPARKAYLFCFDTVPNSLALLKTLSPAFSSDSTLFAQNTGGGTLADLRRRPATPLRPSRTSAALFCSFLHSPNRQIPSLQSLPRSLQKNTGGGLPDLSFLGGQICGAQVWQKGGDDADEGSKNVKEQNRAGRSGKSHAQTLEIRRENGSEDPPLHAEEAVSRPLLSFHLGAGRQSPIMLSLSGKLWESL